MTNGSTPPGWYRDPTGLGDARYWNGASWTEQVSLGGQMSNVPIDPARAQQPPVPGTQVMAPRTTTFEGEPPPPRSPVWPIVAILVALVVVVVIFVVVASTDSDDAPTPDSGVPATEAPAEEAPEPAATDAPAESG